MQSKLNIYVRLCSYIPIKLSSYLSTNDYTVSREYTPTLSNAVCHELPKVKALDKRDPDVVRSI